MRWKNLLLGFITLIVIAMFLVYWFFSIGSVNFTFEDNSNFTVGNYSDEMQFYENMRFPEKEISYFIEDNCTIYKKGEMERAFDLMENETILKFYSVLENQEITVSCDEKNKMKGSLFIAGEGGPDKIVISDKFNVILSGKILLIRNADCPRPEIASHELLHVLGFNHSTNPQNLMYPVTKCGQTIGEDMIDKINELYSIESLPDLLIEHVHANIENRFLYLNLSVRNSGLKDSLNSSLVIYADDQEIKKVELEKMDLGTGKNIELTNLVIQKIKLEELILVIETNESELEKNNNKIVLEIKK
jgi:hypothetical protein